MNENQIKGLLTCKPENTPHAGEVRKYVTENRIGKSGKQWTKISRNEDGAPYTVISVAKTQFESDTGNVSFNLVIEPAQDAPPTSQEAPVGHFNQLPHQSSQKPSQRVETLSKDDYWTIKDQRDREREARFVAQQPRIDRMHCQNAAIALAAIFPGLVCDGDSESGIGPFNFGKLHSLITQFQRDIEYIPKSENEPY